MTQRGQETGGTAEEKACPQLLGPASSQAHKNCHSDSDGLLGPLHVEFDGLALRETPDGIFGLDPTEQNEDKSATRLVIFLS